MLIQTIGDKLEITDHIEQLLHQQLSLKLDKYLSSFNSDLKKADVHIQKRSRWGYKINFSMVLPGKQIYADEVDKHLPTAIRKLRARLVRQLKEYRGRRGISDKTSKVGLSEIFRT